MNRCEELRARLLEGTPGAKGDPHLAGCTDCRRFAAALRAVDLGLAQLATAPLPAVPPLSTARARVLPFRRRTLRTALAGLAAAAAVVAAVLLLSPRGPAPLPTLAAHAELESAGAARSALLPGGARVTIESGALLVESIARERQRLRLRSGAVALEVPKLSPGATLSVATDEAEVQVRGTRFRVERTAAATVVSVTEGVVEVQPSGAGRPALLLRAGETARVEPLEAYRLRAHEEALGALSRGDLPAAAAQLEQLLATEPTGDLEGQTHALLGWVRQASGDRAGALSEYQRALSAAPPGSRPVWADNAAAELALLLERGGDVAGARDAWKTYLARFPDGIHVQQARRHLGRGR